MFAKIMKAVTVSAIALAITGCASFKTEPVKIKVMSYNIRHGADMDWKKNLSNQGEIIKAQKADFAGLQEVDNKCNRSDKVDQAKALAKQTGTTSTFGKFMNLSGGEYGMGTLCRLPLVSSKVVELPPAKLEPRCAILNIAQLPNGEKIALANVHFEWIRAEEPRRVKQAKALVAEIDKTGLPVIILGDFNTTPDSDTMKYFAEQGFVFMDKGEDNLTFQGGGEPKVEIDHVIYRSTEKVRLEGIFIDVLHEPQASDHRPVVAEILVK